jgi:isorenieratene synthase
VQVTEGVGIGKPRLDAPLDAVVVGGGLAGASAAIRLAERGFRVRLLERSPYLGGKLGAWNIDLPGAVASMRPYIVSAYARTASR